MAVCNVSVRFVVQNYMTRSVLQTATVHCVVQLRLNWVRELGQWVKMMRCVHAADTCCLTRQPSMI